MIVTHVLKFQPKPLVVQGLACRRGGRSLFAGLDFVAAPGAAVLLTGPNGAGKTSLLRLLAGLLAAESGTARLGEGEGDEAGRLAEHTHFVGAKDALKEAMTPLEHLAFWRHLLDDDGAGRSMAGEGIAACVGLGHVADLPVAYLSSGQRRRLALGRLLAAPRPLWLLDEPTNALDAAGRAMLMELVAAHRAEGGVVVVATHEALDLPEARRFAIAGGRWEAGA